MIVMNLLKNCPSSMGLSVQKNMKAEALKNSRLRDT